MSRGGSFLLDVNTKESEAAENIATKVEVNTQTISTLKSAKSIRGINPGEDFETSMVGPLGILVALVKGKIGQVSSKSGICFGRTSMRTFITISFSLEIET